MSILANKRLIQCSVLVLFGLYYALYFLPFNNGQMSGDYSLLFLSLKLLGLLLLVIGLGPHFEIRPWSLVLLLGYTASFAILSLRWLSEWTLEDTLFANLYLQLPLLLFIVKGASNDGTKIFCKALAIFMVFQVLLEIMFGVAGMSLWTEYRSAGGVGNPTSFGLLCVISTIYLLHVGRLKPEKVAAIAVLEWGVLLSGSLAAYLSMYAIFVLGAALQFHRWKTYLTLLVAASINEYLFDTVRTSFAGINFGHTENKLSALISASQTTLLSTNTSTAVNSLSISERINQHLFFIETALSDWSLALFGGLERYTYWVADSQYLTYFASYGMLFGLFFAGFNLYALKRALELKAIDNGFSFSSLFFLNLAFLTSRVLDYFPIASVYFIILGTIFCHSYRAVPGGFSMPRSILGSKKYYPHNSRPSTFNSVPQAYIHARSNMTISDIIRNRK
jgi:hypothetical protein